MKKRKKLSLRQELQALRKDHLELVQCVDLIMRNNNLVVQQLKMLTHALEEHLKGS
jgi:hypothetical protein